LNFKEILELIDKVAESGIGSVEVEQAGTKVRIEGKNTPAPVAHTESAVYHASAPAPATPAAPPTAAEKAEERKRAEEAIEAGLHIITSPIVGTYYRAPNPEASPFVNVGDKVSKGHERDRIGRRRRHRHHVSLERSARRVRRETLRREGAVLSVAKGHSACSRKF
jgi:biotin carboxyl carrier protein